MSTFKTRKEKRIERTWRFIGFLLVLGGLAFLTHKFIGFDRVFGKETENDTVPVKTDSVSDTVYIKDNVIADSIPLEFKEGHHYMTITIDGVKLKGMFDSGCTSGISGGSIDYLFLTRHGYIKPVVGHQAIIANGDTIDAVSCMAYNVKFGNITLDSVECSFSNHENAPVLIGQGIISKLGKHYIDYKSNKLYIIK